MHSSLVYCSIVLSIKQMPNKIIVPWSEPGKANTRVETLNKVYIVGLYFGDIG